MKYAQQTSNTFPRYAGSRSPALLQEFRHDIAFLFLDAKVLLATNCELALFQTLAAAT